MPCGKCAAPLEADVNLQVVKDFIADVEASTGAEVISGVRPDQQFSKLSTTSWCR